MAVMSIMTWWLRSTAATPVNLRRGTSGEFAVVPRARRPNNGCYLRLMNKGQFAATCHNIQLPKAGGCGRIQSTRYWKSVFPSCRYAT